LAEGLRKLKRRWIKLKKHELTIEVNAKQRKNIQTNTQFFSMDVGTGKKIITITLDGQRLDLTNATVVLAFECVV